MGHNDRFEDDEFTYICACPNCRKLFKVAETEQIPGFRFPEDMVCPYCGHVVRTSLEFEFRTFPMEDNEKK